NILECRAGDPDQSILAPENLIALAHFSVYAAMNVPKSVGELENTVPPRSAIRAFIRGSARPTLTSLLSAAAPDARGDESRYKRLGIREHEHGRVSHM